MNGSDWLYASRPLQELAARLFAVESHLVEIEKRLATIDTALNSQVLELVQSVERVRESVTEDVSELMSLVYSRSAEDCTRMRDKLCTTMPALVGIVTPLVKTVEAIEITQHEPVDEEFERVTAALQEKWDAGWEPEGESE